MARHDPLPAPPAEPAWDLRFTRLTRAVQPRIEACSLTLMRRFQAIGLLCEPEVRQTPRGLSTFLALVGQRGLICIVDLTLVDGMAVGGGPNAALDIRLLDACGEVVATGLADSLPGQCFDETSAALALPAQQLERVATTVYVATLGQFELLRPLARQG